MLRRFRAFLRLSFERDFGISSDKCFEKAGFVAGFSDRLRRVGIAMHGIMCVTVALYSDYTELLRQVCFVRVCAGLSDKCFEEAGFGVDLFGALACFASGLR